MKNKNITATHCNRLQKVYNALKMRQKMNSNCTQIILSVDNQQKFDEATKLIGQAINILTNIQ